MAVGDDNPNYKTAVICAQIVSTAAERLSKTTCAVMRVDQPYKDNFFWMQIIVGIDPYDVNRLVWQHGDETRYAHVFRLRIPMELANVKERGDEKLRQIGHSLADVWWESCTSPNVRTDRQYSIPYIGQSILGTRTVDDGVQVAQAPAPDGGG